MEDCEIRLQRVAVSTVRSNSSGHNGRTTDLVCPRMISEHLYIYKLNSVYDFLCKSLLMWVFSDGMGQ